jgi:hypothetical protein
MKAYRGRCAKCGAGKKSTNMLARPSGLPIPDDVSEVLPFVSQTNCRLCFACYKTLTGSRGLSVATPQTLEPTRVLSSTVQKSTPPVRLYPPRKRMLAFQGDSDNSSMDALTGRSQSTKFAVNSALSTMPSEFSVSAKHWLEILMCCRCSKEIDKGFGRTGRCDGEFNFKSSKTVGGQVKTELLCRDCGNTTVFCSTPTDGKVRVSVGEESLKLRREQLRKVILILLAGSSYTQYNIMCADDVNKLSESKFYEVQKLVAKGIVACCQDLLKEGRVKLKNNLQKNGESWVASLNGAWSHTGWNARHHSFLIRAQKENIVVCAIVLTKKHVALVKRPDLEQEEILVHEGNYFGTSKGMEGEAFIAAISQLRESELLEPLSMIVCDNDSSIPSIIANTEGMEHVRKSGDPGHVQRNFMKSLKSVFGSGLVYKGFPYRIGKFFMRCLKRSEKAFEGSGEETVEKRVKMFDSLWSHAFAHYTRAECPKACPCNEFFKDGSVDELQSQDVYCANALDSFLEMEQGNVEEDPLQFDEEEEIVREVVGDPTECQPGVKNRRAAKKWLDSSNPREADLIEKMRPLFDLAQKSVSNILFGLNTCLSECSNSRRLVFARKDRFFYTSYEVRSLLSAILENISRADLFQRIYAYFDLEFSVQDLKVLDVLEKVDEKKDRDSARKKSLEYKARQASISKARIEENMEARLASQSRRDERGYKTKKQKTLENEDIFERKRGKKSQAQMQKEFNEQKGTRKKAVKQCEKCGGFFKKKHSCCLKKAKKKKAIKKILEAVDLLSDSDNDGNVKNVEKVAERKQEKVAFDEDDYEDDEILVEPLVPRAAGQRKRVRQQSELFLYSDSGGEESKKVQKTHISQNDGLMDNEYEELRGEGRCPEFIQPKAHSLKLLEKMGSWLDDETINAHVALLAPYLPADVVLVDSYFVGQSGKPGVRAKFLRNGFLGSSSDIKRLIVPVHDVNHWFVAEIDVRSREIRFYDSLEPGKKRKRKCFDVLVDFLEVVAPQSQAKKKWKHVEVRALSEQQNATECGVYTIARIKALVLGWEKPEALICDKNMNALRKLFVKELKAKKASRNRPKL